ncbi:hypothetical protein UYO_3058 [Lachnospiraceae bacterium JC7]|nr:hypothetical protein UYO_3058 [Lachnospiraceae bacterium JC7]
MSELIFVTLYNETYLTRGILLFESLMRVCQNPFKMYILALDDTVHNYWDKREEKNIGIISLEDMIKIYPQVERLQKERSQTEFCWTLSAFSIQYVLKQYRHSMCIYIDADMEFFF